jgi:hypothetical protein
LRFAAPDARITIVLERLDGLIKILFRRWVPDSLKVHYVVTEYDPANPTIVIGITHHHTELAADTDLADWARGPWPPPRYSVEIAGVLPVARAYLS